MEKKETRLLAKQFISTIVKSQTFWRYRRLQFILYDVDL